MLHNSAVIDILFPIVTPLRYQKWYEFLEDAGILEEFAEVPKGLCYGFGLGLDHVTLTSTFSPPNHYKSQEHHDFLIEKYSAEILLNRISPGYPPHIVSALVGHYRTAPIGVIEKELGGKLRAIIDHSFPCSNPDISSMNSYIDSSLFQCEWGSFSACYLLVADAPAGTEVPNILAHYTILPNPYSRLLSSMWTPLFATSRLLLATVVNQRSK
jgi:hypothetical protein